MVMSSFIDPAPIVLSMVISSFIYPAPIVLSMDLSSFMSVIVLMRKDMDVNYRKDHPPLYLETN
jgi:hypothetical protein